MEKTTNKLPEGIQAAELAKLREENGEKNVKVFELPTDDEGGETIHVIVKRPSRWVLDQFEKMLDRDPGKAKKTLFNSCICGDNKDKVRLNDFAYNAAVDAVVQMFPVAKAAVKNF